MMNFFNYKSLLSWLLWPATMFFASGAVIGEVDGGNINDGGGQSGSGEGDPDLSQESTGGDGERSIDGTPGESGEGESEAGKGDGRTLPKSVQNALKTFKEAHPELAKEIDELRKGYFDSRGHREFFKSPAEARQAKATLDLVGGHEGIANLQSQVAAIELVDSSFEKGDPQVLDDISSDYPEGFKKLVPAAIDKLEKMDPVAYGKAMQPHVFAAMEKAGIAGVFELINQAIAGNDLPKAKDLIAKSLAWYDGQKQQAGQWQKVDDPERQKFETERQKFAQEKETAFRNDVGRQTLAHQSEQINQALAPYLKSRALGPDAKADLSEGINREINRLLKADTAYQSQVKALLAAKTRDQGKIVQYINAAVAEAAPKAVKAVWSRRYGTAPAARPGAARSGQQQQQKNPAQSGPVKVSAKPKTSDIVKGRGWDIEFMHNRAVMATGPLKGKTVTW